MDSHLHLVGTFEPNQIEDAMVAVRGAMQEKKVAKPAIPATPPSRIPAANQRIIPLTPPPEKVKELEGAYDFLAQLQKERDQASQRQSLRHWKLENELSGITADVFPASDAVLTGMRGEEPDGKKWVAVRLTPGSDTLDPRTEIARLTHEVEKKLIAKQLSIKIARAYHGADGNGRHDCGVILVQAGSKPLETTAAVNEALEYIQDNLDVLKAKLGRGRGEDHRHRRTVPQEPDATELELLSRMRAAAASGLITLNDQGDGLKKWAKDTAEAMRDAAREQGNPPGEARRA
jgi:hypothetical protein